jgi:hypothetical protein
MQRRQLASLLQQCLFEEAELVQRSLEREEAQERRNAFALMQHDYAESVKKIAARHAGESQTLDAGATFRMTQFLQSRDVARFTFLHKQRKIEKRGEDAADREKLWALAQTQRTVAISKGSAVRKPQTARTPEKQPIISTTIDLPRLDGNLNPARKKNEGQPAKS